MYKYRSIINNLSFSINLIRIKIIYLILRGAWCFLDLKGDDKCQKIMLNKSCLPQYDGQFSKLHEDVLFCLVDHMRSEILTNNAVPSTSVLIHLAFQISGQHSLLFILFQTLSQAARNQILDLLDFSSVHIGGFYLHFKFILSLTSHKFYF